MRQVGPVSIATGSLLSSASYAQLTADTATSTAAPQEAADNQPANVGYRAPEIVVTAQRRAENLQDTPWR